jgi:hypothetical protein
MTGKAQKLHRARSELNSVFGLEKVDRCNPVRTSAMLAQCKFWAFPAMKRELQGKKFRSDQWSAAHYQEVGGKKCIICQGRYFEKRPSPHLHKVLTQSNKVSL